MTTEKRAVGRPTLFKEEFADDLIKFFDIQPYKEVIEADGKGGERTRMLPNKFPTLARFACNCGVTRETLHDWATAKNADGELKHPSFIDDGLMGRWKLNFPQKGNVPTITLVQAYNMVDFLKEIKSEENVYWIRHFYSDL